MKKVAHPYPSKDKVTNLNLPLVIQMWCKYIARQPFYESERAVRCLARYILTHAVRNGMDSDKADGLYHKIVDWAEMGARLPVLKYHQGAELRTVTRERKAK